VQHGVRDVRAEDWPDSRPGPGEVLVRVHAVTICASDVHMYADGNVGGISWDRPFVPGHEAAGVVEDANGTALREGARVVLDPARPCLRCDMCSAGLSHLCRNLDFMDMPPVDGAMRERIAWPADLAFPVPESIDLTEAPLIEPLAVAVHAVELATTLSEATVAIVGCGAIGLLTLRVARLRGARRIIATDQIEERLAVARELGADETVLVGPQDPAAEEMRFTKGRGVDLAFEVAGPAEALQQCMGIVRPAGEVVVIGIPDPDEYRLAASHLRRKELALRFVRRQNENYPEAAGLAQSGQIDLGPLLTHRFPVSQAQEAFDLADRKADGAVRVAVTF
jgi:L-iditol 2-dehydrogenase